MNNSLRNSVYIDPETQHTTYIKMGKPYIVKPSGHKTFSLSKLEKSALRFERSANLGLKLQIADCEKFGLYETRNNIGTVITKDADKLKSTFVSRAEFAERPSSPTCFWIRKMRTKETVIQKIYEISLKKGAAIHWDAQAQTSADKGKGLMSDSDDVGIKMEPGESSNQVDLASPSDLSVNGPISEDKGQTVSSDSRTVDIPEDGGTASLFTGKEPGEKNLILNFKAETFISDSRIANGQERSQLSDQCSRS